MSGTVQVVTPADTVEALRAVVKRAQAGDNEAVQALSKQFKDKPEGLVLLAGGDLAAMAIDRVYTSAFGRDQKFFEVGVRAKMSLIRSELGGPSPTPIESMIVDSIVLAWTQAHIAALQAAGADEKRDCEFYEKRHERANRRMMHGLKSLAHVRRLNVGQLLAAIQTTGDNSPVNVKVKM